MELTLEQAKAAQAHFEKDMTNSILEFLAQNKNMLKKLPVGELISLKSNSTQYFDWDIFTLISRLNHRQLLIKGVPLLKQDQQLLSPQNTVSLLINKLKFEGDVFEMIYDMKKGKFNYKKFENFSRVSTQ